MNHISRHSLKRILCILCAAMFAASAAGCGQSAAPSSSSASSGNSSAPASSAPPSSSEQTAPASANPNFNATGLPILKEKETYKVAVYQTSPIKAAAQRDCVLEAEKATNVNIEWIEIPTSGWKEKINIMFSTDALPDAIIGPVDTSRDYEQLAELDELLAAYAPNMTAFFEDRPDYISALQSPDGKIHCLPTGDESLANMLDSILWINTDWMDKLGLSMPTTTDEFEAVLKAFKEKDPNGNGQADEIPLTFETVWGWGTAIENLFGPFGVLENSAHVFVKDGKAVFSPQEKGYYDFLVWMNRMYSEGLIDKEAFTISAEQYQAKGSGKDDIGALVCYRPGSTSVNDGEPFKERYRPVPVLKGPDGTQMISFNYVLRDGGFSIAKQCKSPETMVRWYDYINSSLEMTLNWGRGQQDIGWTVIEKDGVPCPQFPATTAELTEKLKSLGYQNASEYRNAESFGGQSPSLFRLDYDERQIPDENSPPNYKMEFTKEATPFAFYGMPPGTATPENSERRNILSVDIDTYLKKFIADSVINGIDDAKWQKHLDTLKSLKTDEYLTLCQEYMDNL